MEKEINSPVYKEVRDTPVREECDVLVVGGGAAGIMAALAAARNGARTILVEKNTFPGGNMLGGVTGWRGLYNRSGPSGGKALQLVRGIGEELLERLRKSNGITAFYEELAETTGETMGIHADREILPLVVQDMLEDYGVKLYLRCMAVDTVMKGKSLCGIIMESKSGREAILSEIIVDCTGDANVARYAGAVLTGQLSRRNGGMIFGLSHVDLLKARDYLNSRGLLAFLSYAAEEAGKERIARLGFRLEDMREFDAYREKYHLHPTPCLVSSHENCADMVNGVTMEFNTLEEKEVTEACLELNDCCFHMAELFRELIPGFENSYPDWTPPVLGLGFGRQVACEYEIKTEDIENGRTGEDAIGLCGVFNGHGMDSLVSGDGRFGIPYRALLPKGTENLLAAGRLLSCEAEVFSSLGTVGACFIEGQAAGTAAALACQKQISLGSLSVAELREVLRRDGVFFG